MTIFYETENGNILGAGNHQIQFMPGYELHKQTATQHGYYACTDVQMYIYTNTFMCIYIMSI